MKTVYFLRHGETAASRAWVHQDDAASLSARGKAQAAAAAEAFRSIPLDRIIASPYERTKETARIVATAIGLPVEHNDLFKELRHPRELTGQSWLSPRSLFIMGQLYLHAGREQWHFSDEENLEEFHARARRALEYLADQPEERMLVVTHRGFIANLMERMKRDGMDTVTQYRRTLWKNLLIGNCCYVTATWTPDGEYGDTLDGTWALAQKITCPAKP